ncbi:hypothetical protein PVA38_11090 [Streptococcus pneumoniae D39]|nr:hypothetical protein PVA38_11090 [Streptococcus pneumoniae D39]
MVAVLISGFCFLVPLVVGCYFVIYHKSLSFSAVSYTHLRAHETVLDLVCRLLLEKKKLNYFHDRTI